jgi:hypothetical protein
MPSMVVLGRSVSLLFCAGLVLGCANATQHGRTLYVDGRLVEAAEIFEHGEPHLAQLDAKTRVRYGLYRGATLLKLGDLDGASRWLYFAQQAENHSPGALEPSDALMLRLAFKDLDRRRALVKPAIDPMTGAMAGAKPFAPDMVVRERPQPRSHAPEPQPSDCAAVSRQHAVTLPCWTAQ